MFREGDARFSADGRWVAYVSDQTGEAEVWVRPFPGPGSPIRISPNGGHGPVWSPDGKELFYEEDGKLMAAAVGSRQPELRFAVVLNWQEELKRRVP
jgi:Tol biopolymer transport system component